MLEFQKKAIIYFVIIEALLYYLILFGHIQIRSGVLHYLSIVFCFIFLLVEFKKTKDYLLILIAMFFTVIADFFLTFLGVGQIIGTLFFFFAQFFYMIRLNLKTKPVQLQFSLPYVIVFLVFFIGISVVFLQKIDVLLTISILYYSFLIVNLVLSWVKKPTNFLFAIGLLFYLFCDTLVGLSMSGPYMSISVDTWLYNLIHFPINLIWMFYLPSQVLITLSIFTNKKEALSNEF